MIVMKTAVRWAMSTAGDHAAGLAGLVTAVGVACGSVAGADRSRCVADRAAQDWPGASRSCGLELERTGDPASAVDAATAAYYQGQWLATGQLARRALSSRWAADAHYLIGAAQLALDELAPAASRLTIAATLHAYARDARAQARDHHQLAGVAFQLGDYGWALREEEASRAAARLAHDDRMIVYVDIARADILRLIGDFRNAEIAIQDALGAARAPEDRVMARLKRGMLYIELGQPASAREPIALALAEETRAPRPRPGVLEALHLNLSYVERKAGNFRRAREEIRQAGAGTMQDRLSLGLVSFDEGDLETAATYLAAAEAEKPQGEWAWWVPFQVARVAERRGELQAAIEADRRAIHQVAVLATRLGALGPTLVANHREPHLHLIGLYASTGRWLDALDVVAMMDDQALLASSELAADPAPSSSAPALPRIPRPASVVSADAALLAVQAWRGRRLIIIVPGGDRIWRFDVNDGVVAGSDVGDAGALATLARKLETDPANLDAGRALGTVMLGSALPADTRVALLVIGPLAGAPLASLRVGDAPASERHYLARARGFLPRPPTPRATSAAVVIGDPDGDLPKARREAEDVATRLQASPRVGQAATRAALESARGASLVHIATHTGRDRDGAFVHLADGRLTSTEIEKLTPAPGMVVLASCGAAAGRDDGGNGSLVAAFLDAGADIVIGTRWSVDDADAAQLIQAFYAHGGADDPVRALGAAQRSPGPAPATWAAFEAFVARPTR
jgi:tetratricopeptide (TPR) repeat protein